MKRLALEIARRDAGSEIFLSYQLRESLFRDYNESASPVDDYILAPVSLRETICFIYRIMVPNPVNDFSYLFHISCF